MIARSRLLISLISRSGTKNEESKFLTIVGEFSSVDIELLGNVGNRWIRQSQDNPLTLPLDNSMDDTVLLSLKADLTQQLVDQLSMRTQMTAPYKVGMRTIPAKSNSDVLSPNISPTITQEASMSDSTTGFGGLSLGSTASDSKPVNSMFGSFATPASSSSQTESSGPFGSGVVKPATGFGAFGGFKTSGAFDPKSKPPSTVNTFASPVAQTQTTSSGFGQTGFGQPVLGQTGFGSNSSNTSFGQPAFGKTSLGTTPTTTKAPSSGGFGAFANAPTSFTSPSATIQPSGFSTQEAKPEVSGGFAAFASATQTPFGSTTSGPTFTGVSTSKQPPGVGGQESKPEVSGGFAAFATPTQTPFGSTTSASGFNSTRKGFGAFASTSPTTSVSDLGSRSEPSKAATPAATRTSVFGTPLENNMATPGSPFSKEAASSTTPKETPTRPITMSPPSSPEPKAASVDVSPKPTVGGAFANIQTTPSAFRPAVGFGAFSSTTPKDSPFFKKGEQTTPSSPFTPISSTKTTGLTTTTPAFGSTSVLGPSKPAFASATPTLSSPVKSTAIPSLGGSAFSAFSGSSSPLAVVAGQKKSFSDLLKTGGEENGDPEKPSVPSTPTKAKGESNEVKSRETHVSVFGTQTRDEIKTAHPFTTESQDKKAATPEDKGKGKFKASDTTLETGREESFSNISESSACSSFVEVEIPKRDEEGELDQDSDQDDRSDFLTDEELSEEEGGSDEESLPDEDDGKSPTPSPSAVPLPVSRSASATPQPEVKIQVSDVSNQSTEEPPSREESTTPPGTPLKEVNPFAINGAPSTASPLGIGLGRPSTRPARRSPLANAVVLEGDESQEEASVDSEKTEAETSSSKLRPKTPPTIPTSTNGPGSLPTPPSATSPPPALQSPSPDSLAKNPIVSFTFGPRPVTTPPASSLFGQVADKSPSVFLPPPMVRATTAPTTSSSHQQGLFGAQTPIAPATQFSMPSFTLGKTPPPVSPGTTSMFNMQPKPPQGMPDRVIFGTPAKQTPTVASSSGLPLVKASMTPGKEIIEEGMQKECVNLVKAVEKEIEEVCSR
jgi:nucleoporin NUP159